MEYERNINNRTKARTYRKFVKFLEKEKQLGRKKINIERAFEMLIVSTPKPIPLRERIYNIIVALQGEVIPLSQILRLSEASRAEVYRLIDRLIQAGFIEREKKGYYYRKKILLPNYNTFVSYEKNSRRNN